MKPEELMELNRKLTNWADAKDYFTDEDGCKCRKVILFTDSLDACFKWLVPKLKKLHYCARVQESPLRDNDTCKLLSKWSGFASLFYMGNDLKHNTHDGIAETAPMALCKAISEMIDWEVF